MGNGNASERNKQGGYSHLSLEEREELAIGLEQGKSKSEMARELGRHRSTITRELSRNMPPCNTVKYRANRAQLRADERKRESHERERLSDPQIRAYVVEHLEQGWTPELIAGRIGIDLSGLKTNHESIYQYIYTQRRDLIEKLPKAHRKRHKRASGKQSRVGRIPNRVDIDQRPAVIEAREEFGHVEGDTVVSRQSKNCLAVFVERKSRLFMAAPMKDKTDESMYTAAIETLSLIPQGLLKSLTLDNGTENAMHEQIAGALGIRTYFCKPYHSWEKGSIENRNGILRRYFPKKTDWALIKKSEIIRVIHEINSTPMKCLGFKTPYEVFAESTTVAFAA